MIKKQSRDGGEKNHYILRIVAINYMKSAYIKKFKLKKKDSQHICQHFERNMWCEI